MFVHVDAELVSSGRGEGLLVEEVPAAVSTDNHVVLEQVGQGIGVSQQAGQGVGVNLVERAVGRGEDGEGA